MSQENNTVTPEFVGVDLHHGDTADGESVGIVGGTDVTDNHGTFDLRCDANQCLFQDGGFSGTR